MTYIIYRCDLIERGQAPKNEAEVARAATFNAAADIANAMKRADRMNSYTVGCAS